MIAADVDKEMLVVGVALLLLVHKGRVLEEAELRRGDAPPQPGGRGGGGGGGGQFRHAQVEPGLEWFHTASRERNEMNCFSLL